MRGKYLLFIILLITAFLPGFSATANCFPIPERLEFELSYTGITAGHAVQEVKQDGTDIHIISTARSAEWLKLFFPVDDRIESYLTSGTPPSNIGSPRLYQERKHEGKTITNREARFDRQKVLRREVLVTPLGRFNTIVIHPLLKSEGIFARTGDMFIWLTDDERRIPVQMKSKVAVGSITATLTGGSYWPRKK